MKKQELLNVGWKYLLVLLGFYAVYTYTNNRSHGSGRMHKMGGDHKIMMEMGGDSHMGMDGIEKQIEVRKEVNADGDTTMTVTVNGEEMDPSAMGDHEMMWIEKDDSDDGKKMIKIKKIMGKHKKILKKEKE
jgi:hypothetical protein